MRKYFAYDLRCIIYMICSLIIMGIAIRYSSKLFLALGYLALFVDMSKVYDNYMENLRAEYRKDGETDVELYSNVFTVCYYIFGLAGITLVTETPSNLFIIVGSLLLYIVFPLILFSILMLNKRYERRLYEKFEKK